MLDGAELDACKSIVRGAQRQWKWKSRWLAKREQIPALKAMDGDDEMTVKQESMLTRWAWLYANSKGFRKMLITQGIEAQVIR